VTITDANVRKASAALDRLVLDKVIDAVTLRFTSIRVVIHVTTKAQDELSVARVRRQVQTALQPFLQDALIIVEPGETHEG
jgi:hypothetical protein